MIPLVAHSTFNMSDKLDYSSSMLTAENQHNYIESDIMTNRERIQKGLELCQHVVNSNPLLVLEYVCALPVTKEVESDIEQIAIKIANFFPNTILKNLNLIQGRLWAKEVEHLAIENSAN